MSGYWTQDMAMRCVVDGEITWGRKGWLLKWDFIVDEKPKPVPKRLATILSRLRELKCLKVQSGKAFLTEVGKQKFDPDNLETSAKFPYKPKEPK